MELVITSFSVLQLYNGCPESNVPLFFSKNLLLDHENYTL